jgi:ParB-like chromosome segregation protein Spo0J
MKSEIRKLTEIRNNPENPRYIRDEKFAKLVKSLKDFPEMIGARPLVVNQRMEALGGNMRLKAMIEAGWTECPVVQVDWSEEKQREFIIKDNVGYGEWDWDMIANEWDADEVKEWGLDIPVFEDFSDKNQELDVNGFEDEMIIKLKYSEDDYEQVREQLSKISATPEQAVWKLLGNE